MRPAVGGCLTALALAEGAEVEEEEDLCAWRKEKNVLAKILGFILASENTYCPSSHTSGPIYRTQF